MPDMRKQGGVIEIIPVDSDKVLEIGTVKCVHCGGHFTREPGSGKVRGFCQNCNGHVCGPGCAECVPEEKMLDIMEGTRDPTAVSVGGGRKVTVKLWLPGDA